MNFTKTEVEQMRIEMTEAMNKVAKKYGAVASFGGIRYGLEVTSKVTISKKTEDQYGEFTLTKAAKTLKDRLPVMGLKADVLNEPFTFKGDTIVIKGYNTRARAYPIEYTKNGRNYKCSVSYMKDMVIENRPELFL